MADDYMRASCVAQHESCNFTGKGAFASFGCAILCGDFDFRSFQAISNAFQSYEPRSDNDFAMVRIRDQWFQCDRRSDSVTHGLVHLPIASNYRFTHKKFGLEYRL